MPNRNEPTLAELERALQIDEHHLEEECRDQAEMYYRVSKMGTLAASRRDAAKQALAEVEAELDAEIRHDAEIADEKVTEGAIKSKIRLDRRYKKAARDLQELQIEVGKLTGLERSYDHRKEMLKVLVKLYLANYFGEIEERGTVNDIRNVKADYVKRVNAERGYGKGNRRNE